MLIHISRTLLPVFTVLILSGCHAADRADPQLSRLDHVERGFVTDLTAFESFIASRPTPDQFRQRYPDVLLVLPGDISTFELRGDNSRYFAEVDDEGCITGGHFQ